MQFVRCRLDRAVANSYWAELYPTARSQYLEYEGSDHKPLISFFEPDSKKKGCFDMIGGSRIMRKQNR